LKQEHLNESKTNRVGPVTSLKAEFDQLQSDVNRLKSEYLRSLAEFDNFRRRKEKELADFREFANERLLQDLVPVLDNFQRALQAAEANGDQGSGVGDQGIRKGLRLIHGQLKETLARLGFEGYSCVGEQFDPRRCEAVGFVETAEQPEQTIVSETAQGYVYKGRVLRPAMVTVAKGSHTAEAGSQKSEIRDRESEDEDSRTEGAAGDETPDGKS
jgi:molecular chaperone GrpE